MNERAFQLGPEQNLTGIWTHPAGRARRLVVLTLNAGVIHRIGAHRTSVKLTRLLAAAGFPGARFDLCGVGDSRAPRGAADFRTQAVRDIQAVMDAFEAEHGPHDFALVGICSGAAHAQATALLDPRVKGVFLIDGFAYPTLKGRLHFLHRMRCAYGWRRFAARFLRHGWTRLAARGQAPVQAVADEGPQRTRDQYAADMRELVRRDVQVSVLFTGSILEVYGYERQLQDSFAGEPWIRQVHCIFEPEMDHTVTLRSSQEALLSHVSHWVERLATAVA